MLSSSLWELRGAGGERVGRWLWRLGEPAAGAAGWRCCGQGACHPVRLFCVRARGGRMASPRGSEGKVRVPCGPRSSQPHRFLTSSPGESRKALPGGLQAAGSGTQGSRRLRAEHVAAPGSRPRGFVGDLGLPTLSGTKRAWPGCLDQGFRGLPGSNSGPPCSFLARLCLSALCVDSRFSQGRMRLKAAGGDVRNTASSPHYKMGAAPFPKPFGN